MGKDVANVWVEKEWNVEMGTEVLECSENFCVLATGVSGTKEGRLFANTGQKCDNLGKNDILKEPQ